MTNSKVSGKPGLVHWGRPRVLITDKLQSYGAAKREIAPGIEHRQHKGLNNRSEASHRHTRRREKIMGRFKSPRQAQRVLSVHDQTACLFRPKRHRLSALSYRHARSDAYDLWTDLYRPIERVTEQRTAPLNQPTTT